MPAVAVINVRTIGVKRARIKARGPNFSKKSCVRVTYSCLKIFESGRLNRAGPIFKPTQ